ncbi:ribonuclease HII [Candidatus Altiarchaeota archaeon]
MTLLAGIDEAGRGPVIGPLVLAIVTLDDDGVAEMQDLNVRDSKKVAVSRRLELEPLIKEAAVEYSLIKLSPGEIDSMRKKMSLNLLEAYRSAELITLLKTMPDKVTIDATDNIAADYRKRILDCIETIKPGFKPPAIVAEHKADDNYIEVSAASILAKVERDRDIEELKVEHGNFGSGYPADPRTQEFLAKLVKKGELPDCVRMSWSTIDKFKQASLGDF